MTFIALWIICGIITAAIAHSKNLNVAEWFALGVILGIFGIPLALWQDKKQP